MLLLALGILGLIRLLPEFLQASTGDGRYSLVVTMDGVLALATAVAGEGVRRGKGWAPKLAVSTSGMVVPTSIGVGFLVLRSFNDFGVNPIFLARIFYYLLVVAIWPVAVRTLLAAATPDSRRTLVVILVASLILGVPLGIYLNFALR